MRSAAEQRRRELAKIHIAKKQLGLDDDTYRDMLATVVGVRSATKLDAAGRRKVLEHMKRHGFKGKKAQYPGTPHNIEKQPKLGKIEALLTDMGLPWSYADNIAHQMFDIGKVAWLREAKHTDAIIAALSVEQEKRGLLGRVDELLQVIGRDRDFAEALIIKHRLKILNWQRNRKVLRTLVQLLSDECERANDV